MDPAELPEENTVTAHGERNAGCDQEVAVDGPEHATHDDAGHDHASDRTHERVEELLHHDLGCVLARGCHLLHGQHAVVGHVG